MRPNRLDRVLLGSALLASACGSDGAPMTIHATLEEDPVAGIEVTILPYDPRTIRDSLARDAPTPRPAFPELEAQLFAYQPPDAALLAAASAPWRALRDTLTAIADSLEALGRGDPAYATLFRRFEATRRRLAPLAARRDSAVSEILGDRRRLAAEATAAAEQVRAWEESALADYPRAAAAAAERSGRPPTSVITDSTGSAHARLAPGTWWAVARWPDAANPFLEYAWHVPFVVRGSLPLRIPLTEHNAEHRWRH